MALSLACCHSLERPYTPYFQWVSLAWFALNMFIVPPFHSGLDWVANSNKQQFMINPITTPMYFQVKEISSNFKHTNRASVFDIVVSCMNG